MSWQASKCFAESRAVPAVRPRAQKVLLKSDSSESSDLAVRIWELAMGVIQNCSRQARRGYGRLILGRLGLQYEDKDGGGAAMVAIIAIKQQRLRWASLRGVGW